MNTSLFKSPLKGAFSLSNSLTKNLHFFNFILIKSTTHIPSISRDF